MKTPQLEIFEGDGGQWYWRLKARNGEIQCQSEAYPTRSKARRGARAAQKAMAQAVIEVLEDRDGDG